MFTLHIEHAVTSYDAWKRLFDADPRDRRGSGVLAYRVMRPVDDPDFVLIDLDFATREGAERMHASLRELWNGPGAAVMHDPAARLVEVVEAGEP